MPVAPGLQATLAVVLPLLAAAPFLLLAAYFVALALRAPARGHATPDAAAHDLPAADAPDASARDEGQDEALPPLGTVARRAHDEAEARARAFDFNDRAAHAPALSAPGVGPGAFIPRLST